MSPGSGTYCFASSWVLVTRRSHRGVDEAKGRCHSSGESTGKAVSARRGGREKVVCSETCFIHLTWVGGEEGGEGAGAVTRFRVSNESAETRNEKQ